MTADPWALPPPTLAELCRLRVSEPGRLAEAAAGRLRREDPAPDGRLVLLAADHPARGVLASHDDPYAMANRASYLGRIRSALACPGVDGVMGTPDVLEDLLLLDTFTPKLLDDRLVIGCINRGGLAGAVYELDDVATAYTPQGALRLGLDGLKAMVRIAADSYDSVRALERAGQWITAGADASLLFFLEPLPVVRSGSGWLVDRTPHALSKVTGIASALGATSLHTWLKLPYVEPFSPVCEATTLPILLLGGESRADLEVLVDEVHQGLAAGPNVRGVLMGRNVLYSATGRSPQAVASLIAKAVHHRLGGGSCAAGEAAVS